MATLTAVFHTPLDSPTDKLVLLALADHGASDGTNCFPSVETLTEFTCLNRATIFRSLKRLKASGYIETGPVVFGRSTVNYRVCVERLGGVALRDCEQKDTSQSATGGVAERDGGESPSATGGVAPRDPILRPILRPEPKTEPKTGRRLDPDDAFIASLRVNPAYKGIDLDRELGKMDAWLSTPQGRRRSKTRRFVVSWLNRASDEVRPISAKDGSPLSRVGQQSMEGIGRFIHAKTGGRT